MTPEWRHMIVMPSRITEHFSVCSTAYLDWQRSHRSSVLMRRTLKWKTIICQAVIRNLGQNPVDTNGVSGIIDLQMLWSIDVSIFWVIIFLLQYHHLFIYTCTYILIIDLDKHTSLSGPLLLIFTYRMLLALVYFSNFTSIFHLSLWFTEWNSVWYFTAIYLFGIW